MPPRGPSSSYSITTVNEITSSWKIRSDNEAVAIFCETVIVNGNKEIPVQVSIVDSYFKCRLHRYIKIPVNVVIENYRIFNHGLPLTLLRIKGYDFSTVRAEVLNLIAGKIVIGYNLPLVLNMLELDERIPKDMLRDFKYSSYFYESPKTYCFERIVEKFLELHYGKGLGLHCATRNAEMAMRLFMKYKHLPITDWTKQENMKVKHQ